jgi:hypothetical protein
VKELNMEKPCLNDKNEYPDDEVLERYLGEGKTAWDTFIDFISEKYPLFTGEWRYYNDGKNWLYKITKKTKTVCWVSVYHQKFKTTFYFPDRAEPLITESQLKKDTVDRFVRGKHYGKTRGISVEIQKPSDLREAEILIQIKEQIK